MEASLIYDYALGMEGIAEAGSADILRHTHICEVAAAATTSSLLRAGEVSDLTAFAGSLW
jgi:hypothetical protein